MPELVLAASLIINGLSYHFATEGDYKHNYMNTGVGYTSDVVQTTWGKNYSHVGMYKNSFYDVSTYAMVGWKFNKLLSVETGLVTGYPYMKVMPVAYPVLDLNSVRMLYLPKICKTNGCAHTLGVQFKIEL